MKIAERTLLDAIHYLTAAEQAEVGRALEKAKEWHEGQMRDSGEPYVTHPIVVTEYLSELEAGKETLIAALLHDVVEDQRVSLQVVKEEFGEKVAELVDGVTKLSKVQYEGRRAERQVASLRKMLLTASDDLRVIFIKLADRWHNIRTLDALREEKQQRIAHETLDIYVPFARLVGLWELKTFMEEICFPIAFPEEYRQWHDAIAEARKSLKKERMDFVNRVNAETTNDVEACLHEMTDYEIFEKLQGNINRLENVRNIDSVLIFVQSSEPLDCYRVLGEIHARHPLSMGSFRDYISNSQPNGYRALHTTVFLSQNHRVRLRIQTQEMYEYASKRKLSSWVTQKDNDVYAALASLHTASFDKEHYLNDLKGTVLKKRINVFTTSGEIFTLPQGATGVDFAFIMNPDHISYLEGIRINGESCEATHVLGDGDTVELILLSNEKSDKRTMWMDKVKSVDTREELKKSLLRSPKKKRQDEGRALLELECHKRRLPVWWLSHLPHMQKQLSDVMGKKSYEMLLEEIGSGLISVGTVIDAYKKMLTQKPSWTIRFLKCLHLLPRSRVLNKEALVMDIEIYAEDRKGLINDITRCFAERDINIARFGVFAVPPQDALYKIRLEVADFDEFSVLFDALLQVPSVKNVLRKR